MRSLSLRILALGAAGAALGAPVRTSAAPVMVDTTLHVTREVSGLSSPTTMVILGPGDYLVNEKATGRVQRVTGGVIQATPALDLAVNSASERGLLGSALHPDFPTVPWVYLYYTPSSTNLDTSNSSQVIDNRIVRYSWNGSTLTSPVDIVRLPVTPGPNHDGGIVLFGPDRKLYAVIGELNRNGQLQNYPAGPVPDTTGVILRMNDDGTAPPDNPFAGQARLGLVYAYGVRNSFGLTFDPVSNALWETEAGPSSYDEVNRILPGSNGGWEQISGPDSRSGGTIASLWMAPGAFYHDPEFSWAQVVTPTPILFLRTDRYGPALRDKCIIGDNNFGKIYLFTLSAGRDSFVFGDPLLADRVADNNSGEVASILWGQGFGALTDFDLDATGVLHAVDLTSGAIWRFDNSVTAIGDPREPRGGLVVLAATDGGRRLRWRQAADGPVDLVLSDVRGRRVRHFPAAAGGAAGMVREMAWDGLDDAGRRVSAGVFRLEVRGAGGAWATGVVLLAPR